MGERCTSFALTFPTGHPNIDVVTRNLRVVAPDVVVLDDERVIDRPQSDRETDP
jgi:hypothetical protein